MIPIYIGVPLIIGGLTVAGVISEWIINKILAYKPEGKE